MPCDRLRFLKSLGRWRQRGEAVELPPTATWRRHRSLPTTCSWPWRTNVEQTAAEQTQDHCPQVRSWWLVTVSMVHSCCAHGRKNKQGESGLSFHRFPANPEHRKKWIAAVSYPTLLCSFCQRCSLNHHPLIKISLRSLCLNTMNMLEETGLCLSFTFCKFLHSSINGQ